MRQGSPPASPGSSPSQPPKYVVVRCLLPTSVTVPDIGVRLVGKNSTQTVLYSTAAASEDLRAAQASRRVSVSGASSDNMRVWPLARPVELGKPEKAPLPAPVPDLSPRSADPEMLRLLGSIDEKLGQLLQRPSAPPAEVVAAHVRALGAAVSAGAPVPQGLPGAPHPKFIPSTIMSDEVKSADIKVKTEEVSADVDVGGSTAALRNMRRPK